MFGSVLYNMIYDCLISGNKDNEIIRPVFTRLKGISTYTEKLNIDEKLSTSNYPLFLQIIIIVKTPNPLQGDNNNVLCVQSIK